MMGNIVPKLSALELALHGVCRLTPDSDDEIKMGLLHCFYDVKKEIQQDCKSCPYYKKCTKREA